MKTPSLQRTIILLALIVTAPQGFAQGGVPLWTNRYMGASNSTEIATALAVSRQGNLFVTGYTSAGTGWYDYLTVAYSASGVPLWTNRYGGPADLPDIATGVAVAGDGNVIVTGHSVAPTGAYDYATVAYSATGTPLWTNRYNGRANDDAYALALAADRSGNVFVTGGNGFYHPEVATLAYSSAGVPLWTNHYSPSLFVDAIAYAMALDSSGNVFVAGNPATIKYSSAGLPLWTNLYFGEGVRAIAVGSNDNVVVTGSSVGSAGYGADDYVTVAYSNSGVPLWTNCYNGSGNGSDAALAMAVDQDGNIFVTGQSRGSNNYDYATVAYSSLGLPLWTNRYNGPVNGDEVAVAVAVDSTGNVIVTGYSTGSGSGFDYATITYSGVGVPLCTNRYNGAANGDDRAVALVVDRNGNVIVTGHSEGSGGYYDHDFVTIKYASNVAPQRLDLQLLNNQLVLSWTNAALSLQSAPATTGTFTNLPGATSPHTNPITSGQQFFRLISN